MATPKDAGIRRDTQGSDFDRRTAHARLSQRVFEASVITSCYTRTHIHTSIYTLTHARTEHTHKDLTNWSEKSKHDPFPVLSVQYEALEDLLTHNHEMRSLCVR